MMAANLSDEALIASIMGGIRSQLDAIIEEEADLASTRVRERVRELAPNLVMNLLRHFDFSRQLDRFIITVKQEIE